MHGLFDLDNSTLLRPGHTLGTPVGVIGVRIYNKD